MSLEHAFRRLAIRPSSVCHECRRSITSSAQRRQLPSATTNFTDSLLDSRQQTAPQPSPRYPPPDARSQRPSPDALSHLTPTPPPTNHRSSHEIARAAVLSATASTRERKRAQDLADLARQFTRADLEMQVTRRWKAGDIYAPHDLSGAEMSKWKKLRRKPKSKFDILDQLGINPLHHYKNFSMMSEYITNMGRIKHSSETGLRPVNQRRMAKAIRRAMGMGLMPGTHRHPELIMAEELKRSTRY